MNDREFKVKLISSKNSFLFLSDQDFRSLDQDLLIRLCYGLNKRAYFSLGTSLPSLKQGELALCSVLARELGIFKNDTVTLSSTPFVSSIQRLNLKTSSKEDYEVLEILADNVQNTLMNQVRIVHNEQKLVIWVSPSVRVSVTVDGVTPLSPGKLEFLTEVAILPPEYNSTKNCNAIIKRQSISKNTSVNRLNKTQSVLRLHPLTIVIDDADGDQENILYEQPFNVFLSRDNFSRHFPFDITSESVTLVNLRIISPPPDPKEILNEKRDDVPECIIVRVLPLKIKEPTLNADILYVNKSIFYQFNVRVGAKVLMESMGAANNAKADLVKSVEIITSSSSKADELVRNYLAKFCQNGHKLLLNCNLLLEEPNGCNKFRLKFTPDGVKHLIIDSSFMRSGKLRLADVELVAVKQEVALSEFEDVDLCMDCCNFKETVDKCLGYLLNFQKNNTLITGKNGCGKSAIVQKIGAILSKSPLHIFVEVLNCRTLKGKNVESMQRTLSSVFQRLIYYQPSVLIMDDLHVICEKVVEGEAPSPENLHFTKISQLLSDELQNLLQFNRISLLATTDSLLKLNQNIFNSRGLHLFTNVLSIQDPSLGDRNKILDFLFSKKSILIERSDVDLLARKSESFLLQDLIDLVDKVLFEAIKDDLVLELNEIKVEAKHCEAALKNSSTLALRNVQLHSPGERDFSDVGGLEDVKSVLVESLLWPVMYPNIFSKSPLRLQSGTLLYGPPGTGKTILAGAAAKQCNLRLISVKGPELLSKYIGASEQAVRDVFEKAQSAKPCILFFDEFDSLAPRRGHDNTGVTDRVVNQFLTQLDGVESLSGVCVLAATSRPDLLDPALLRPGRLDRQILCPMPDKNARLDILKALAKRLNLHPKINLENFAEKTEGFSGADLQAVLYTAQLNSVENILNDTQIKTEGDVKHLIVQKHLDFALKTTRPSLSKDEKAKYDYIYGKFHGKGDLLDLKSGIQRATLA